MIDSQGYRANVGIILYNDTGRLFWCKRCGQNAWQFPQGGICEKESPEQALYRELEEETGLMPHDVEVVGATKSWLRYRLPDHLIRQRSLPKCVGQKQRWYLLRMLADEDSINLYHTDEPEFDGWRWVDYWKPIHEVVFFKRKVYQKALTEFAQILDVPLRSASIKVR